MSSYTASARAASLGAGHAARMGIVMGFRNREHCLQMSRGLVANRTSGERQGAVGSRDLGSYRRLDNAYARQRFQPAFWPFKPFMACLERPRTSSGGTAPRIRRFLVSGERLGSIMPALFVMSSTTSFSNPTEETMNTGSFQVFLPAPISPPPRPRPATWREADHETARAATAHRGECRRYYFLTRRGTSLPIREARQLQHAISAHPALVQQQQQQ
ncbi:hypothetical protein PG999_014424 [Apiospora kogelbergensis]|uniref:Uncharacterized protein n=1 Tax=Apiospora kogelbergensis TaxID=1337665 RepID=A0AAW0QIM4_9PEZI